MQVFAPAKSPAVTELKRAIVATFGGLLYSVGVNLFIVPIGLYNGGLMGYCQLLRTFLINTFNITFSFDFAGILYFLLNIPIMIIAWVKLDRKIVIRGLINIVVVTIALSLIPVKELITGDVITNCIVGGAITGIGTGLSLWAATPGGGTDIIGMMLVKRNVNFSVGRLNLIVDVVLYLLCFIFFNPQVAIYSIVYSVVCTFVTDKLHRQNINVQAIIVTKAPADDLKEDLFKHIDRGITELPAKGGYTGDDKVALLTVISKYEVTELIEIAKRHDEQAFITFNENSKISGNFEKRL